MKKYLLILILTFSHLTYAANDYVVLLHGFLQSNRSMSLIEKHLKDSGYDVLNIKYPSNKYDIETLANNYIMEDIKSYCIDKKRKIHFVGYSMGGVLARYIVENNKFKNLGKVVVIASPSQGSEVASVLTETTLYKSIFGPAICDLKKDSEFLSKMKNNVNYELGVLAGNRSMNLITSFFVLSEENDGLISVESTKVSGMKDHKTLEATHNRIYKSHATSDYVVKFIQCGEFKSCSGA